MKRILWLVTAVCLLTTTGSFPILTTVYRSGGNGGAFMKICSPSHLKKSLEPSYAWHAGFIPFCNCRNRRIMTMSSSSQSDSSDSDESKKNIGTTNEDTTTRVIRVLALHGSEGSGKEFLNRLQPLQHAVVASSIRLSTTSSLQMHALDAPFVVKGGKKGGFRWWQLPPGERSYTANTYPGFEQSLQLVLQEMDRVQPDLIIAHSQGAIFIAALLALQHTATIDPTNQMPSLIPLLLPKNHHIPPLGYILNGLAWPNPFTAQLVQLVQYYTENNKKIINNMEPTAPITTSKNASSLPSCLTLPTSHDISIHSTLPRILVIIGKADTINPPESAERVARHFQQAGFPIQLLYHNGGHGLPFETNKKPNVDSVTTTCLDNVVDWIFSGRN